ncbi:hypothetical protein [Pseudomonas sp.]|uniref:hypothetical protein n=1 Tax=Pseudomonas sp. TaxID=306 RepID=UPI002586BCE2|nr:hypothetical protein [Pseudomonas sp.]
MITLKNLTNSPQPVPLAAGGTRVVAAGATESAAFSPDFCELLKHAGTFTVEPYVKPEPEQPRKTRSAKE